MAHTRAGCTAKRWGGGGVAWVQGAGCISDLVGVRPGRPPVPNPVAGPCLNSGRFQSPCPVPSPQTRIPDHEHPGSCARSVAPGRRAALRCGLRATMAWRGVAWRTRTMHPLSPARHSPRRGRCLRYLLPHIGEHGLPAPFLLVPFPPLPQRLGYRGALSSGWGLATHV